MIHKYFLPGDSKVHPALKNTCLNDRYESRITVNIQNMSKVQRTFEFLQSQTEFPSNFNKHRKYTCTTKLLLNFCTTKRKKIHDVQLIGYHHFFSHLHCML